jgi:hypothetical protein
MSSDLILPPSNLDLATLEVASVDLSQEYWTPQQEGERKRMVFAGVSDRTVLDQKTGEEIQLPCAVFIVPGAEGEHKTIVNGSKRLVAVFENGSVANGTPVQVTFTGKKKNRTNGNMSDTWSVVMLAAKKEAK